MNLRYCVLLFVVALAASANAQTRPTPEDLQRRLDELEQKVRMLESAPPSKAEVDATVAAILHDADQRSKLIGEAADVSAGYNNGFYIRSKDGRFSWRPSLLFQFRGAATWRDGAKADGSDDFQSGFEVRRMRFIMNGNAFGPDLTYRIYWDTNREGGGFNLVDAWIHYQVPQTPWGLRVGQLTAPHTRELMIGAAAQLGADSSVNDALLGGGLSNRVQGVTVTYGNYDAKNPLNAEFGVHDGANSINTDFRDTVVAGGVDTHTDWGVIGRIEWKAFGNWNYYKDLSAANNRDDGLLVFGAAADLTGGTNTNQLLAVIDAQWEQRQFSVFASVMARYNDNRGAGSTDRLDWGPLIQAGYMLTPNWEVFGRYGLTCLDDDFATGDEYIHELTAGVNYFIMPEAPSRGKLTFEATYLPNGAPAGMGGLDVLTSNGQAEFVLRAQFQLSL